jgi:spoIIIJ-associated protein
MAKKAKGRDFYGQEVTALIGEACREFGVSQEELDIEVLETGSAGIFGLCRKKAHIRVRLKSTAVKKGVDKPAEKKETSPAGSVTSEKETDTGSTEKSAAKEVVEEKQQAGSKPADSSAKQERCQEGGEKTNGDRRGRKRSQQEPVEPPTEEVLARIKEEITQLLSLMGYPSEVNLKVEDTALRCQIEGEHEEAVVGSEGRTLDSMQYLLRKMMAGVLPDRMMLSLDAGDFRRRRAEELKERALALAEEVRETGKTQAIPALNPAERREVHMILQEDKTIRSRSVGDGLFKKVLIYKPGSKSGRPPRKRKRRSSGRTKEN